MHMAKCCTLATASRRSIELLRRAGLGNLKLQQQMKADAAKAVSRPEEDAEEVSDDERLRLDIDLFAYDEEKLYTDLRAIGQMDIDYNMSGSDDQEPVTQREKAAQFRQQFGGEYSAMFLHYLVPTTLIKDISQADFTETAKPVQFILRDTELSTQLQLYIQDIHNLKALLGGPEKFWNTSFCKCLKLMHGLLRRRLNQLKTDKCQVMLKSHLYELLPVSKQQQQLLPAIKLDLGDGAVYTFTTSVRKGLRPKRVCRNTTLRLGNTLKLCSIRQQVWRFLEVSRIFSSSCEQEEPSVLLALQHAASERLENSLSSLGHNLSILEYMAQLQQHLDVHSILPSDEARAELHLLMETPRLAKIAGSIHMDMLQRIFQFSVAGELHQEVVHPRYLHLFVEEAAVAGAAHLAERAVEAEGAGGAGDLELEQIRS